MAYSGVLDDVQTCINLGIPRRVPVFALSIEFDVRIAGMTHREYRSDVSNIVRVQSEGIERFGYDWSCIYLDDSLEFEPLGVMSIGGENTPMSIKEFLPAEYATLKRLNIPRPDRDGRLPLLIEAISRMKDKWGDEILVCGRAPAPFSCATLLYGMRPTMLLIYDDPQLIRDTAEYFIEQQFAIADAQLRAGADAIWVGDCSASSRFISLDQYRQFAREPAGRLVEQIRKAGGRTLFYTAEPRIDYLEVMAEVGADVLNLPEEADIAAVKQEIGGKICLMGNLDPINVLLNGTPDDVAAHTRRIRDEVSKQGGHIFNTGEGVPRDTPEENVRAMMRVMRET